MTLIQSVVFSYRCLLYQRVSRPRLVSKKRPISFVDLLQDVPLLHGQRRQHLIHDPRGRRPGLGKALVKRQIRKRNAESEREYGIFKIYQVY